MSSITLDFLDSALHSVEIKDAAGNALNIDSNGYITSKVNGDVNVTATDLDIRDLTSASDSVEIKTAAGQALGIDASGFITANVNGTVAISDLVYTKDSVSVYQAGAWNIETVPASHSTWKVSAESVTTTESELVATPLTGRLSVLIQNLGNNDVYLLPETGVSVSNGMKLPKGSSYSAELDAGANIFAISSAGTADIRIVEYAL